MFNSLYTKLVFVLFLLCLGLGMIFLMAVLYTAQMYQQEVSQQLNRSLAMYIVDEHVLIRDGEVVEQNLETLFHKAMIINPSLDLYLLDDSGAVIAHSLPAEHIRRQRVSLEPIQAFLSDDKDKLILGDNPGDVEGQNSFSVAPIEVNGERQGYIYAIFGSERYGHASEMLQRSLIVKWSVGLVMLALLFAFLSGLVLFFILMRKLRMLSRSMQNFDGQSTSSSAGIALQSGLRGDEIDTMAVTFEQMAGQIHAQMQHLKETDTLRRELVANVSHDLRTPLSSLGGYLETLLLKSGELSESEKKSYLKIAHDNAGRLSSLVEELFELAKLDANEIKPHQERFSLAELVYDVIEKFRLRAEEKAITFEVETGGAAASVFADVGMIERVLDNLIDNALKHTPDAGRIRIQLGLRRKVVQVSVSDTGQGIASEEIPHIFDRFYHKQPNGSGEAAGKQGLGLGLAISSRMVELHGSALSVDSILHQGTTFQFSLPATEP